MPSPLLAAAGILVFMVVLAGFAIPNRAEAATSHHSRHARHSVSKSHIRRHARVRHTSYRHRRHHVRRRRHSASRGPRSIAPERVTTIQQALIHANYLSGSPSGQWDSETEAAMKKYQSDNGWQSKIAPDSRALIKLGLGPKQDQGEYSTQSSGATTRPGAAPADTIRTLAASALPTIRQN